MSRLRERMRAERFSGDGEPCACGKPCAPGLDVCAAAASLTGDELRRHGLRPPRIVPRWDALAALRRASART